MSTVVDTVAGRIVLVTGSRVFENRDVVWRTIEGVNPDVLVAGDCPTGADQFAWEWQAVKNTKATPSPVVYKRFVADWAGFGKQAGPLRNQAMVDWIARADPAMDRVCLAFFAIGAPNRGTLHCATAAARAGIGVHKIWA